MSKGTLLLVDDDRQLLTSMADWLRSLGYDVEVAQNCERARKAMANRVYDVALLDVRLPDGDGFDLLAHCRRQHPKTSAIMITAMGPSIRPSRRSVRGHSISSPSH